MKRKIIALIDQEPEVKRLVDLMEAINEQTQNSITFVKSRLDTLVKEAQEKKLVHLRALSDVLKGKGVLPPQFNMDAPNHYIGFDLEENTISFAIENAAAAVAPQVSFRQMEAEEIPPEVRKAIIEHLTREDLT